MTAVQSVNYHCEPGKVKRKMQRIDRTRRHFIYKLRSGKRVLIILVAIGGILLIFSYVVQLQSQNLIRKQFYESDVKKWDGIHKRKLTAEYYGHHSDHTLKTTESSTKVETLSVDDNGLDTNTFITIGGGADLMTTTEGRTNDSEFYHYDQDTFDPFEPFLDQFSQSAFSDMKADSRSKPFKNNLFTFYCKNSRVRRVQKRNKNLIVYENFIAPNHNMKCDESIFYTTHGDYRYLLNNLIPLVVRWNGPVSVAIYCPGNDLRKTLKIINFLRSCTIERIRELVTFHLFFDVAYSTPVVGKSHWQWLDSMYQEGWCVVVNYFVPLIKEMEIPFLQKPGGTARKDQIQDVWRLKLHSEFKISYFILSMSQEM